MPRHPRKPVLDWSHRHWSLRPLWLRNVRRRHRWLVRAVIGIPLFLVVLLLVLTRSPLTRALVEWQLERALNLDVEAASVYVRADGRLIMDQARFRLPGVAGAAGQFLNVARIQADLDWWSLLGSNPTARSLVMDQPVVIVSQSIDDGSLNLDALSLPASSGTFAIPPIQVRNAGLELGEHQGDRYTPLRHILVDGFFRPAGQTLPDGYHFRLQEAVAGLNRGGFFVSGTMLGNDLTVRVEHFSLDDWPATAMPSRIRARFADLALSGAVPLAVLRYTPDDGLSAEFRVEGVAMNLPLEPTASAAGVEGAQGPFPRFLRMRDVSGSVTFARERIGARVEGLLVDLPYTVTLDYRGLSEIAPFVCELESRGFRVESNPSLLPYAPAEVREWLQRFSSPTAVVNTTVRVEREPPIDGQPGPIRVAGDLHLSEGTAAYEPFPYRFADMTGHFRFTDEHVEIVEVTGRSASGATLRASGLIAPLDQTAEVRVDVDVRNAPIDEAMERAFGPQRAEVLRALFNRDRYQELLDAGLVQSSEGARRDSEELERLKRELPAASADRAAEIQKRIDLLGRRLRAPVFDLGGTADVSVHVHSPRGEDSPYSTSIEINIPSAGLVPERFPLPVAASGVRVQIENETGRLVAGEFRALGGGEASITAIFNIPERNNPDVRPDINIAVRELPVSPLLIHALPGPDDGQVKSILRALRLAGAGSGTVRILPRLPTGDDSIGFDVDLAFERVTANPDPNGVCAADLAGRLRVSESALDLAFSGRPQGSSGEPVSAAPMTASITADFGEGDAPTIYDASVSCPGLSLEAPVETLIRVFSDEGAKRVADFRAQYAPEGAANVSVRVQGREQTAVQVAFDAAGDVAGAWHGGRVTLRSPSGSLKVLVGPGAILHADNLAAQLLFDDRAAGQVTLDGRYLLQPDPELEPPAAPLRVRWREAPFESPLVSRIIHAGLGQDTGRRYDAAAPTGQFEADLAITAPAVADAAPDIRGQIRPRTLALMLDGQPVAIPSMGGHVEFEPGAGVARALTGAGSDWSATVDAAWRGRPDGGLAVTAQLTAKGQYLAPDFCALLPHAVQRTLDDLSLRVEGPFTIEEATIDLGLGPTPADEWTRVAGILTYSGLALEAGVPISDAVGHAEGHYTQEPGLPPSFRLDIEADSFRVGDIDLDVGRAVVESGQIPGEVLVPSAAGDCYGGRFAARARVLPPEPGVGRPFEASLQISGARFSPLLRDLSGGANADASDEAEAADFSRGQLDAELSVRGMTGLPAARRGRGSFRVSGGRVLNLPFVTRLIEVSNLILPGNAQLDYAAGSFYIDGGLVTFDDLAIHSSTIAIEGFGTMTWPEKILDMRFNSRSERPIPILSALIRGIRDELVTTVVRGKFGEHEVRLQQFPGPRRMLGRAVGSEESAQTRRLSDIERRAREHAIRPAPGGIRATEPGGATAGHPAGDEPPTRP